jgi:hypothetical protein
MIYAYVCTKFTIEYWLTSQQVKKSSKFDLPGPPTDSHGNVTGDDDIPIASKDSPKEPSPISYGKQKLPAAYEALEKQEFRFTS